MAEMKISNTLVNDDSSQKIAYARQLFDEYYKKQGKFQHEINADQEQLRKDFDTLLGSSQEDVDDVINTFKEVENFLKDYKESDTLKEVLEQFIKPYSTRIESLSPFSISLNRTTGELIATYTSTSYISNKSQLNPKTGKLEIVYTF